MRCIKTGVHAYVASHMISVYGDAFVLGDEHVYDDDPCGGQHHLLIRVCQKEFAPIFPYLHIMVEHDDHWFDLRQTSGAHNSTLIVMPNKWKWLGYKGEEMKRVDEEIK